MSTQDNFSAALLDTRRPCPDGLCSANGADPASRFAVYRNNVQSSLIDALADTFPVVEQLVGGEFFRAMAAVFIRHHPPRSPLLSDYGEALPAFIEVFEPASSVPYLADVARLERLRVRAFHAADACSLSQEQIAAVLCDPRALSELHLVLHPSVHLLDSPYAVVMIWAAHQRDATLKDIDINQRQHALVLRNGLEVEVFNVDHGTHLFIHHLLSGQPLLAAAEHGPPFDLSQALTLLITHNAITCLNLKVSP